MLEMQLSTGAVLSELHVEGFASDSPPSADANPRYYKDPNLESASVLAGTLAHASRVYSAAGMPDYSTTLKNAASNAWSWLLSQSDSAPDDVREIKAWAAAEVFRADPTVGSARAYVDGFYPSNWSGRFFNVTRYDTLAALVYVEAAGATAQTTAN